MDSASEKSVTIGGLDLILKQTSDDAVKSSGSAWSLDIFDHSPIEQRPDDSNTFIYAIRSLRKFDMDHNRRSADQSSGNSFEGKEGQDMGRHASRINVEGDIMGVGAHETIGELRKKYLNGQPLELVSRLSLEFGINQVLIEELIITSVKGSPYRFQYSMKLVEYVEY